LSSRCCAGGLPSRITCWLSRRCRLRRCVDLGMRGFGEQQGSNYSNGSFHGHRSLCLTLRKDRSRFLESVSQMRKCNDTSFSDCVLDGQYIAKCGAWSTSRSGGNTIRQLTPENANSRPSTDPR
jgi:hypothetical protein